MSLLSNEGRKNITKAMDENVKYKKDKLYVNLGTCFLLHYEM
jgi:hypothetical protein